MKCLVLICVVYLMFTFATSDTNTSSETTTLLTSTNLALPGCESRCGDLIVPYPFGIGTNCSIDGFSIYCNTSSKPHRAYYYETSYTSIKLISDSTFRLSNLLATKCYNTDGTFLSEYKISADYTDTPFTFSNVNMFTVIGCDDFAWLNSHTLSRNIKTGCMVFCSNPEDVVGVECSGNGCCQSSIPKDIKYYDTRLKTLIGNSSEVRRSTYFNPCTYAFVGDAREFKFNGSTDLNDTSFMERIEASVSLVLDWAIGNLSCPEAMKTHAYACQANSLCVNSTGTSGGYRCICNPGYEGNPYLKPGCQDIDECKDNKLYTCYGGCVNTPGSYNCTCPRGFVVDARNASGCQHVVGSRVSPAIYVIIALVFALLAILSGVVICVGMKRRNLMMLRGKYFEQNGGVLLKQKINLQGAHEAMTLFSPEELLKATNAYSQKHIIGRGAYGVVYKGVLSDKRLVAVKKSKLVDVT